MSYNRWTGPLEAKAAQLPESAWSEAETTVWRDGTVQTAQYDWFRYQPGGWERPQRFAVVRHRAAEGIFGAMRSSRHTSRKAWRGWPLSLIA